MTGSRPGSRHVRHATAFVRPAPASAMVGTRCRAAAVPARASGAGDCRVDRLRRGPGDDRVPRMPAAAAMVAGRSRPGSHSQVLTWNSGTLNDSQLEIMSILARHKDKMPVDWSSIQDKINDPSTPSDLKAALQALANDPALFFAIGSQGDGNCKGKIKAGDVSKFADNTRRWRSTT
ncbi:hypothetical protein FUT89_25990, partial [Ralstonia pseudosolanacearum]